MTLLHRCEFKDVKNIVFFLRNNDYVLSNTHFFVLKEENLEGSVLVY